MSRSAECIPLNSTHSSTDQLPDSCRSDPYSKTVVGVSQSPPALLILDPHYSGLALTTAEQSQVSRSIELAVQYAVVLARARARCVRGCNRNDSAHAGRRFASSVRAQLEPLWRSGWISWKPLRVCLASGSFYNFGLPRRGGTGAGRSALGPTALVEQTPPPARALEEWRDAIEIVGSGTAGAPTAGEEWSGTFEVVESGNGAT